MRFVLKTLPPTLATRLVVAYVALHEAESPVGVELSVRSVQWLLRRRSRKTGAYILRRAIDEGWLLIVDHHVGRTANSFGLGPRALADRAWWNSAGEWLFGDEGLMLPWLTSGWMYSKKRGGLDIPGCFVLALLGSEEASSKQVAQRSNGFISEATAKRELAALTKRNIIARDVTQRPATFRRVVSDEWFNTQESELRLAALAARDDEKIAEERARHDDSIGAPRRKYREWLKEQSCVYCLRPASSVEPIEIEHVPPKKLGGGPLTAFEIPAHRRCHAPHSAAIRRLSRRRPPGPTYRADVDDEYWDLSDEELLENLATWVGCQIMHYAASMNGGDLAEGERAARRIAAVAAAAASPHGAFILRQRSTGSERALGVDRWFFQREVVAIARAWTGAASIFAEQEPPPVIEGH